MEHLKKKKSFSWRDLLYKSLLFVATVALIVYFLPRDGKFNYQFDINKPWKYGQLIATFDFPIYKDEAVVKREQDSLLVLFQPYYELDKKIEKGRHQQIEGELSYEPERDPSIHRLPAVYRTHAQRNLSGRDCIDRKHTATQKDSTSSIMVIDDKHSQPASHRGDLHGEEGLRIPAFG